MSGYRINFLDADGGEVDFIDLPFQTVVRDADIYKQFSGFIGLSYPEYEGVSSVGPIATLSITRTDDVTTTVNPPA